MAVSLRTFMRDLLEFASQTIADFIDGPYDNLKRPA